MTEVTPAYVKALFHTLVKAVGGTEAAGAFLGITNQRVSQLQSLTYPDLPNPVQIWTLEKVLGSSIVHRALADAIEGEDARKDLFTEACEVTEAAVELQKLARAGAEKRVLEAAAARLCDEAADIPSALHKVA